MFRGVVLTLRDPALPTLPRVFDLQDVLPHLAEASNWQVRDLARLSSQIEVLRHRQGKRCAVRYTFTDSGQPPQRRLVLIGKVYHKQRKLAKTFGRQWQLSEVFNGGGRVRVVRPLAMVEPLALALLEYIDAQDMRFALANGEGRVPAALAGSFLGRLHALPPFDRMEQSTVEDELEKVGAWCRRIANGFGSVPALARLQARMDRLAADLPLSAAVMIHRDFYYAHVLCEGDGIWVLDFDQLSIGDPAFDLGLFLAHLEELAYSRTGSWEGYADEGKAFVDAYRSSAPDWCVVGLEARLQFYIVCGLIKLGSKLATRQPEAWKPAVDAILERAQTLTSLA